MVKVLNYGSLNIDMTFHVPHIVLPGETLSATAMARGAGGKGANQSAALGRAGATVFHAGKIGHDGQFLLDQLVSCGVDVRYVRVADGPSGQAIIQVDAKGQNSIVLLAGENRQITMKEIDETLTHFDNGDWLVLQNEINHNDYLITQAHAKGMHVCLNPAPYIDSVKDLPLQCVDLLIVNEIEGQGLSGVDTQDISQIADALSKQYPHAEIIVTGGNKGSCYAHEKKRILQEVVPIKVVDTTGAGDTFIGFFLASHLKGLEIEESLAKAALASSIAISRPGAMPSIPSASEVF